jgi:hypothetical protein
MMLMTGGFRYRMHVGDPQSLLRSLTGQLSMFRVAEREMATSSNETNALQQDLVRLVCGC